MIEILAAGGFGETAGDLAQRFGWKPAYFFAQVLNFALVLFVLKKFAFGPIQELLEKRKSRIQEGEDKLVKIEKQLADSEKEKAALIEKANLEAKRLITEAKDSATALGEQKAQEATSQAQTILTKAQEAARAERATIQAELKKEFGRLVVATTSQVTGKTLDEEDQKRINEEAVSSVQAN